MTTNGTTKHRKTLPEKLAQFEAEWEQSHEALNRKLALQRGKAKLSATAAQLIDLGVDVNTDKDIQAYLGSKKPSAPAAPAPERRKGE